MCSRSSLWNSVQARLGICCWLPCMRLPRQCLRLQRQEWNCSWFQMPITRWASSKCSSKKIFAISKISIAWYVNQYLVNFRFMIYCLYTVRLINHWIIFAIVSFRGRLCLHCMCWPTAQNPILWGWNCLWSSSIDVCVPRCPGACRTSTFGWSRIRTWIWTLI